MDMIRSPWMCPSDALLLLLLLYSLLPCAPRGLTGIIVTNSFHSILETQKLGDNESLVTDLKWVLVDRTGDGNGPRGWGN